MDKSLNQSMKIHKNQAEWEKIKDKYWSRGGEDSFMLEKGGGGDGQSRDYS